MTDLILTINAGSSSIKFCIYAISGGSLVKLLQGSFSGIGAVPQVEVKGMGDAASTLEQQLADLRQCHFFDHSSALSALSSWFSLSLEGYCVRVVSHRVVHGGNKFSGPVIVNSDVLRDMEVLVNLAPLHQPICIQAIKAMVGCFPTAQQLACFDTAFHRTMPQVAQTFALPPRFAEAGVKPYGFHGLSYEFIAANLPPKLGDIKDNKVVIAHLGQGASMCAMVNCQSVATTMGFTPLDGLPMATRSGTIDAGVVFYLNQQMGMSVKEISALLNEESGLLGLSGLSSDIRQLVESHAPRAAFAMQYFVYRICRELGSLVAAMGGLDGLIFTGGVGDGSAFVRGAVCEQSHWLGIKLDNRANDRHAEEISRPDSPVSVWAMATDEEQRLAYHGLTQWQSTSREQPNHWRLM